jgi:hypothetical protein
LTETREHPPPAAPAAAMAATRPGRVVGLAGIPLFWLDLAWAFEVPFQRHLGWIPLRQAMSARLWPLRRTAGRRRQALAGR